MIESNEIFDIRQKHLVGKLILSPVSKGRIIDIKTPSESSIVTVTAKDLKEKDLRVMNEYIPVLADGCVHYLAQPVMAVFGPDTETVDMFCAQVEINIDTEDDLTLKTLNLPIDPFIWTSGNVAKYFTPEAKVIETEFTMEAQSEYLPCNERILATTAENSCYIKISSQWPIHVKESVARALGIDKKNTYIFAKSFRADFDQLLINPSIYAVITAVASKKSGTFCELIVPAVSWQPETKFRRQTVVNNEGKAVAEKISVTADFGAFPLFKEEAYHNLLAGLIAPYEMNAAEVNIQITRSTKAPSSFFGDLGYSTAVAFTEYHFNRVAKEIKKSPYSWRVENLNKISLLSEKVRRCYMYDALEQTLEDCTNDSWFNRKFSVFSQRKFANQKVSPVAGYAKGIGLACAYGVGGFSEFYPYGGQHHLTLTMGEDGKVYLAIGFYIAKDSIDFYKDIISKHLNIEKEKIIIVDINNPGIKDFGPNVLSRSVCVVPRLVESACLQLAKNLSNGAKLPASSLIYYPAENGRPLFDANTVGSIAISVHIDPIKVVPVIDNITARLKFGKVLSTTILARRIRQTICTTIAHLCPCIENNYVIDLKVKSNPNLPSGSCSSMLRGITTAAFASAVSQALAHDIHTFPINDKDLISIVKMKNKEVENEN